MRPALLFACAALWLGAAAPLAADDWFTIRKQGSGKALGVVAGEVRAVATAADHDWSLTLSVGLPISLRVVEPEKWSRRYLAYDPQAKGKDKGAVFLANKRGEGTEWVLERVKGERSSVLTIQAASGKYQGWFLDVDVEDKGKEYADDKGKEAMAYRVLLSEKPKKVPKWVFSEIGR